MVLMGRAPYVGLFSSPGPKDYRLARQSLADVGISHLADKSFSHISGGEMQLVLIARSLVSNPDILILDEPESHLDFKNQLRVLNLVEKLVKTKKIICIINTHHPDHALRISDKTLLLGNGKNHMVGRTEDVITPSNIEAIFGVRVKLIPFEDGRRTRRTIVPLAC
jgi:iron complex transport system ATP-binding protein